MKFEVTEMPEVKIIHSEDFHVVFNRSTKTFVMWGVTTREQPEWSSYGPLVAHIEITNKSLNYIKLILETICSTKTLCLLVIDNSIREEKFIEVQKICKEYNVECIKSIDDIKETDWSTFALYINGEGNILSSPNGKEIQLEEINNFVTDVWYSDTFKTERYKRLISKESGV